MKCDATVLQNIEYVFYVIALDVLFLKLIKKVKELTHVSRLQIFSTYNNEIH